MTWIDHLFMSDTQLTSQQKEAVEHGEGPLLIVAGAGTGKTLVITHRIAHIVGSKMARPEEILAVTFTEKAASEMAERVDVLLPYGFANVQISTFHAFGDRILREFGLELGLNPNFQVLSQAEQVIFFREYLFEFPLKHYRPLSDPTCFIQAMLRVISRAKDEDVSPEEYRRYVDRLREREKASSDAELLEEIEKQGEIAQTYAMYQELLAKEGKSDFGDQVSLVLKLFREHPLILQQVQERYRFILVDEFQDTNYAQYQIVKLLAGEKANITVVGDDDQSIYKFRGAAISNILNFMDDYPQSKQVVLTENFRSSQNILDTAYRLIKNNNPDRLEVKNRIDKRLVTRRDGGHPVEHLYCDTLTTESDRVAQTILELVESKKAAFGDIAILVRANNDADPFLRALNMKEIPWRFTGNRGLYARPEVRLLMGFLRAVVDFEDSLSLYQLASSEIYELSMEALHRCVNEAHRQKRSLYSIFKSLDDVEAPEGLSSESRVTIRKIVDDLQEYLELSRDNETGVVLYRFLTGSGYLKRLTGRRNPDDEIKVQNIARFFDVIWSFSQAAREDRVLHFVRYLDLLIEAGDDPGTAEADSDEDAVHVMTVHKAKGLEWSVVFMVGLVHLRFPHTRRRDPIELPEGLIKEVLPEGDFHLQEERRLFYVGMTRARDRLTLTSAQDYGGVRKRKVSPFVLEALDRPKTEEVNVKARPEERIQRFAPPPEGLTRSLAPIPDDEILTLSHFHVDDYLTCPLKYKYIHILRVPILPHHTVIYGKALHAAVELYHRKKMNGSEVRLEDLLDAFERAWRNIGFISREHEERRLSAGREALRQFFEREEASAIVPKMIEEKFSFVLGRNRIAGRWDRVDERDGKVVVVDFKSSEVYRQEAADRRANESLQLAIYAMAYARMFEKPADIVELHFLESGIVGKATVTEKMLTKTEEKIGEAAAGIRHRDYTSKPNYQACKYCAYRDVCPDAVPM